MHCQVIKILPRGHFGRLRLGWLDKHGFSVCLGATVEQVDCSTIGAVAVQTNLQKDQRQSGWCGYRPILIIDRYQGQLRGYKKMLSGCRDGLENPEFC